LATLRRAKCARLEVELALRARRAEGDEGLRLAVDIDGVARMGVDVALGLVDQLAERTVVRLPSRSSITQVSKPCPFGPPARVIASSTCSPAALAGSVRRIDLAEHADQRGALLDQGDDGCGSIARFFSASTIERCTSVGVRPLARIAPA